MNSVLSACTIGRECNIESTFEYCICEFKTCSTEEVNIVDDGYFSVYMGEQVNEHFIQKIDFHIVKMYHQTVVNLILHFSGFTFSNEHLLKAFHL